MHEKEGETYIQDNLFSKSGNTRDKQPEQYYTSDRKRRVFLPSQIRYVDERFAIIQTDEELKVLTKENLPKTYPRYLNEWGYRKIFFSREWVSNPHVIFNPEKLKNLKIVKGIDLEDAGRDLIGGKAVGEMELKTYEHFGYRVPALIVAPTSFYEVLQTHGFLSKGEAIMKSYASAEDIVSQDGLDHEDMDVWVPEKIQNLFESMNYFDNFFMPFIAPELRTFYLDNCQVGEESSVIIRSSSPLEDGDKNFFQGVFSSVKMRFTVRDNEKLYDNIFYENIYEKFKEVMLSPWTIGAESYLRNRNLVGEVSRSLAVIFQIVPKNLEFLGRAYFDNGQTEVEYIDHILDDGNYVGNRIYTEKSKVVRRIDDFEDYGLRKRGDFGKLMTDEKALEISQIVEKLSAVFPKYDKKFNIELGVTKDGTIYIFQIRPTKREPIGGTIPDLSQVDRQKVLFECSSYCSPFSIGKAVGPVVNLLKYDHAYRGQPQEGYLEEIARIDKERPGSIFVVRLNIPNIKKINILTPNRRGIIICYEHDSKARNDHCVESLYSDPTFHIVNVLPALFKDLENGMRLGIVSNGRKAVFYKPDDSEPNSVVYEPSTMMGAKKYHYSHDEYFQKRIRFKK